jgi:hypothetical protein
MLCAKCTQEKPAEDFHLARREKRGRAGICKSCKSAYMKDYWARSKNASRERKAAWREENREYLRERARQWYAGDAERIKEYERQRRLGNKVQVRAHNKVRKAIVAGRLVKPVDCSRCGRGDLRIEAHHHKGYEFPLDVTWLCKSCHRMEHVRENNHGVFAAPNGDGETHIGGGLLGTDEGGRTGIEPTERPAPTS